MAKYHGVAVNFGLASGITTLTGLFQSRDHTYQAENELIKNGSGDSAQKTYFDLKDMATFDYVATAAGTGGTAAVTVPAIGDTAIVTDTQYPAIAGTNWLVEDVDTKGSNTTAVRVTVKLVRYPLITS